jgi:hypothetical protein
VLRWSLPALAVLTAVLACHWQEQAPAVAPAPAAASASAEADPSLRVLSVAVACTKIASCSHPHDAPRERDPAACVDWWVATAGTDDAFAACIGGAKDCAGIDVCVRRRGNPQAASVCASRPKNDTTCQGGKLVQCGDDDPRESVLTDCGALQATCGEHALEGGLVARACLSSALCPDGAPAARCDGDAALIACHDGAVERETCLPTQRCEQLKAADGTAVASCEPNGHRHCDDVGARRCDGAKLLECMPHAATGMSRTVDCASFGFACDAKSTHPCVSAGPAECDASTPDGAPRCDGDALVFCAAGKKMRVPCTEVGFAACDPDAHGTEAACSATRAQP